MRLKHLKDRFIVYIILVIFHKFAEFLSKNDQLLFFHESLFFNLVQRRTSILSTVNARHWRHVCRKDWAETVRISRTHSFNLSQHKLGNPGANYHALGSLFRVIRVNFLPHQIEILDQAQTLICLQILQTDSFETETTWDEIGGSEVVLLLSKKFEGINFGNIWSLFGIGAISHRCFNILLFQEVLPRILVFSF